MAETMRRARRARLALVAVATLRNRAVSWRILARPNGAASPRHHSGLVPVER